jgi:hypothetical protein
MGDAESSMAAKKRVNRSKHRALPTTGRLEDNVDAILKSRGLELNASVDKILERSARRRSFVLGKPGKKRLG